MNTLGIRLFAATATLLIATAANADVIIDYTVDAGGNNNNPLNGLAARGTFAIDGNTLTILMQNTSTGLPDGFEVSDSLLVSVAFNLGEGLNIATGESALIGPGSVGLGIWSDRSEGDSVGEQWLWSNDFGGDLLEAYSQVISTSNGQGGGTHWTFDGVEDGNVGGPFGGMAADPPLLNVPDRQFAVSDSILFTVTLSDEISEDELRNIAMNSIVEFGSDMQYLKAPTPGSFALLALSGILSRGKRRRK